MEIHTNCEYETITKQTNKQIIMNHDVNYLIKNERKWWLKWHVVYITNNNNINNNT